MGNSTKDGVTGRPSRVRIAAWSAAGLLLLTPLVAMQFTNEVDWSLADFVFMGVLMLSVGIPLELAVRRSGNAAYRAGVGLALAGAFLMVWVNGAVGIIGSEDNDANAVYFGVLMVLFVGSLMARFRPLGLMRTMMATSGSVLLVTLVALVAGWGGPENGPMEIVGVNAFFFALFAGSAALFRQAVPDGSQPL